MGGAKWSATHLRSVQANRMFSCNPPPVEHANEPTNVSMLLGLTAAPIIRSAFCTFLFATSTALCAGARKFLTSLSLLRALPWRKFKKGSTLVIELGGEVCNCMMLGIFVMKVLLQNTPV